MTFLWSVLSISAATALFAVAWMATGPWKRIVEGSRGELPFDGRSGGYSRAEAVHYLSLISDDARQSYLGAQRIADTILPFGLTGILAGGTILAASCQSVFLGMLLAIPSVFYLNSDLQENAAVAHLLRADPAQLSEAEVDRASDWTQAKFRYLKISGSALIVALAIAAWSALR